MANKPKKTKTGQFVTSEEVLQQLRAKHPIVADILDYRGLKKLLGTYVDALPKLINPRTGHIHTSFNQAVTATGRLSSSDPNLQNIPVRGEDGKEIRKCFIPEPGCQFFSADYSQIELRVMAHLSGDEHMIRVFTEGHDLHAATASTIYKKPIEEVTRDERTKSNVQTSVSSTASPSSVLPSAWTSHAMKPASSSTASSRPSHRCTTTWRCRSSGPENRVMPRPSSTAAATSRTSTHIMLPFVGLPSQ